MPGVRLLECTPRIKLTYLCPEFNEYNDALFNIRARSLNNLVYWLAQILGSILIGLLLDRVTLARRTRAFTAWVVLLAMVFIVHTWAYFYQRCARLAPISSSRRAD